MASKSGTRDSIISRIRYLLTGKLSSASVPAPLDGTSAASGDAGVTHLEGVNSRLLTMEANSADATAPGTGPSRVVVTGAPGQIVGPYRITRVLGKGGMGEVFEAAEIESGRPVALKVLSRSFENPAAVARFLREGRLAATVSHPNSVYVYASQEIDGVPVIAMELVPGGTVEELVERGGPLASAPAVDAILQVIAGLEAAQTMGVLHRDIKPSNCFIDASGMVKVGDYGLSMSTMATGQSTQLTVHGTFLGTPAYASPEQVSGGEIDVRSDIYAVGATLYFLLTGRTPFAQPSMMQVFAAVLREDAVSPRVHAPATPEKLAEIVLRCLRKDPAARYSTYAELRRALRPFSSVTAEAAPIRTRFLAWLIDSAVLVPIGLVTSLQSFRMGLTEGVTGSGVSARAMPAIWVPLTTAALTCTYYGVLEGRWGAALGKRLCGLRVVGREQTSPGVMRAVLRTATFTGIASIGSIFVYARFGPNPDLLPAQAAWIAPINLLCIAGIWMAARKRNGFRGLHEWASGTRTVRLATERRVVARTVEQGAGDAGAGLERIGEYVCEARFWSKGQMELFSARDTVLRRSVWIHRVPPGTPPATVTRQSLARETRLRMLATVRTERDGYDVYEAVAGAPMESAQPWHVVRPWLIDVANELGAAIQDGTLPATLSEDQVWVTQTGGVRMLDIPVRHASPADAQPILDLASAQGFLGRLADRACGVRGAGSGLQPLPHSARSVIDALHRRAFTTIGELREALQQTSSAAARVSRWRRVGSFAVASPIPVLVLAGLLAIGFWIHQVRSDPTLDTLSRRLGRLAQMDGQTLASSEQRAREGLRIDIGNRFAAAIDAPATWRNLLLMPRKAAAERARQAARAASAADRERAAIDAQPVFDAMAREAAARSPFWQDFTATCLEGVCLILAIQGVVSIVLASFLRGPAGLRLLGLTVAATDGAEVTRLRSVWRGVIAWSPVMVATIASLTMNRLVPQSDLMQGTIAGVGLSIFLAGLIWTLVVPDRGPQDRLAGTIVVPL